MKEKLKIANILACILVVVIAFTTINIISNDQHKNAHSVNSNVSAEEKLIPLPDDYSNGNDVSDDNSVDSKSQNKKYSFTANDYLTAFDAGLDSYNNNLGWKSILEGELKVTAGISIDQALTATKIKLSNGNYYSTTKSSGTFKTIYQESYVCETRGKKFTYFRESDRSPITSAREVMTEEEIVERDGSPLGAFPLIINKNTVLLYDAENQPDGYNPASSDFFKSYYNTTTKMANYEFKLPLDLTLSVEEYKYCVRSNSLDLADGNFPVFTKVVLSFVVDENGDFVSYTADMIYKMYTKGIKVEAVCYFKSTEKFYNMNEYLSMTRPTWAR